MSETFPAPMEIDDIKKITRNVEEINNDAIALQKEINTNLGLANSHFNDFVIFNKEFDDNIAPILNRINNDHMAETDNAHIGNIPNKSPGYQEKLSRQNNTPTQVIDCEVLFITDTNLHRMKPEIMNNGTKAQKIFCPTIGDIEYIINNNAVKKKPNIIYIQCGTNDIEGSDFETDTIGTRFKEIVKKMKYIIDDGEFSLMQPIGF